MKPGDTSSATIYRPFSGWLHADLLPLHQRKGGLGGRQILDFPPSTMVI